MGKFFDTILGNNEGNNDEDEETETEETTEDETPKEPEESECELCKIKLDGANRCDACDELEIFSQLDGEEEENKAYAELIDDALSIFSAIENEDEELPVEKYIKIRDKILEKKKAIPSPLAKVLKKYGV